MPSLTVCKREFRVELDRLREIYSSIESLEPRHRYPIAELLLLRLFDTFEYAVSQTAFRLACGAKYLDGTNPILLARANSIDRARSLMLTFGRARVKTYLEWSKASMIVEAVQYVISPLDHFVTYCQSHGVPINELRLIRNVIAHTNKDAKIRYCVDVLRPKYGSDTYIRPGIYLLTQRFVRPPIEDIFSRSEILIKELTKD